MKRIDLYIVRPSEVLEPIARSFSAAMGVNLYIRYCSPTHCWCLYGLPWGGRHRRHRLASLFTGPKSDRTLLGHG